MPIFRTIRFHLSNHTTTKKIAAPHTNKYLHSSYPGVSTIKAATHHVLARKMEITTAAHNLTLKTNNRKSHTGSVSFESTSGRTEKSQTVTLVYTLEIRTSPTTDIRDHHINRHTQKE